MDISFQNLKFEEEIRTILGISADIEISEADLQKVNTLDCTNFNFDNSDIDMLCKCSMLEVLAMSIGNVSLEFLSSFPHLKELDVEYWSSDNYVDFNWFRSLSELTYLRVSGGVISNMDMINLEGITNLLKLKEIHLHEFGTVDLKALSKMPWIEILYCGYANRVYSVESIALLPSLSKLTLIDFDIENQVFLEKLPVDLDLELCGINFLSDFDISKFSRYSDPDICEIEVGGVPWALVR